MYEVVISLFASMPDYNLLTYQDRFATNFAGFKNSQ